MLQVYDRVLTSGSMPTLVYLTVVACGLILVSAILEAVRSRILVRMSGSLDAKSSDALLTKLLDHSIKSGVQKTQPLKDAETVRGFITGNGLFFFFDAPWVPLFLFVIYLLHPLLFVVATIGAILLFLIALLNEYATRAPLQEASMHSSKATGFSTHMFSQAETVESMGMLPGLKKKWLEENRKALSRQAKASDRAGLMTAMSKFVRPVLQVAILGTGAWLAIIQEITPGAMVAASIIMGRALAPVEGAISNWRSFVMARSSYYRLKELFLEEGREISKHPLRKPKGLINVEKLVMAPPGVEVPVIKGISFSINPGEVVGIIGPSASGKSTLAKGMVGVWAPSNGSVRLDSMNIYQWNHLEVGESLGYLPQDVELFEGTIADNISRFYEADKDAVIQAAVTANVHELILRLPKGYDTQVGPGGSVLSGGQRQRIGLARAVFGSPKFLVLDEPNSNLDSEGEAALREALIHLKKDGVTIVIIAHRPSVLAAADKVLILRDGMIDQYGPKDEVLGNMRQVVRDAAKTTKNGQNNQIVKKPVRVA